MLLKYHFLPYKCIHTYYWINKRYDWVKYNFYAMDTVPCRAFMFCIMFQLVVCKVHNYYIRIINGLAFTLLIITQYNSWNLTIRKQLQYYISNISTVWHKWMILCMILWCNDSMFYAIDNIHCRGFMFCIMFQLVVCEVYN